MTIGKRVLIPTLFLAVAVSSGLAASYNLDLSRGSFPGGVETANLNGVLPEESVYKHGYTTKGWTVDRLDNRGYVALSPSYNGEDKSCENLMTMPELEIEENDMLCWEARSVYRHFPESYRVVAYPEDGGEPAVLMEVESEDYAWKNRSVALDKLAGRKVKIGFVCTSNSGYMLAVTGIKVGEDESPAVETTSDSFDPEFTRALVVDKATGMWCNNCPEGDTAVEALMERFGSRLLLLNTHVNDVLANTPYWDNLKFYSVPRLMLNRIRATEGGNAKKFEDYYDQPTSFGIRIDAPVEIYDRKLKVSARVKVAEEIDNPEGRYRVGYVVTDNFHHPDDERYRQQNKCSQPAYGAFYFLPSVIPSALMYYDDVTLTSETAFTGIEGSLPEYMVPGESYGVTWEFEAPRLLVSPEDARIVAFVIDTVTGELMNATALEASSDSAIRETMTSWADSMFSIDSIGTVRTSILPGEKYCLQVFDSAGIMIWSKTGLGNGNDSFFLPETEGLMIVRLSTPRGNKTIKFIT